MKTRNTLQLGFSVRPLAVGGLLAALLCLVPSLARGDKAFQAWAQRYNGQGIGDDHARAVAVDGSNNVIVTGDSAGSGSSWNYATIKYSQAGAPLWTNRFNGPGNSADIPYALAVDPSGNVVVTGYSFTSRTNQDYATIKYSSAGVPLWTNYYDGPRNYIDNAYALAIDAVGNVYVTGRSFGSDSMSDYATIAYSPAGVPLWTNRYNGPGNYDDNALALAVDGSNNVIVTGASYGGIASYTDYATIKYSSEGVPLWTNRYNGPGNYTDSARALVVDGSNNVIVTGVSDGGPSGTDYATLKYSSEGVPLWTNRYNGPGNTNDAATALAVDANNNVYVTGWSVRGSDQPFTYDYATVAYSAAGLPLWTNLYTGGFNDNQALALAACPAGGVAVTGQSWSFDRSMDFATVRYSSDGAALWTNRYNGPGNGWDVAHAIAVDAEGDAIVAGESAGSGGDDDFATVKYTSVVPPPVLTGLRLTNGTCQLRVDELLEACTVVIETSTKLAGWVPIFTNTKPTNVLFYTDPQATSHSWRFYRAFQFP
ncbi:MAG TPA: hypothetical protein VI136_09655 [Verrucomicrobiae bacterium]